MGSHITPKTAYREDILQMAQGYILQLHHEQQDARLTFHNYQQTVEIVRLIELIAEAEAYPESTVEIAILAGWFFNIGYLFDYSNPIDLSMELAVKFLRVQEYPTERLRRVLETLSIFRDSSIKKPEQQLFNDAVFAATLTEDFFTKSALHRLELELMLHQKFSKLNWAQFQMQKLMERKFYTAYAKTHFEPIVARHILEQKAILEKIERNPTIEGDDKNRLFQNLERKIPDRASQTFFRSNFRNHINLSAIADNKANIMISVNSILISVLITIMTYRNITQTNPSILLPAIIFLVSALASLIFAILSARPKVTQLNKKGVSLEQAKQNIVFFGNFVQLDLPQYEAAMDAMLRDGELLYGNMARDLYYLGKVLDKKYRYLTVSYNIFMIGFIATVTAFLVTLFK